MVANDIIRTVCVFDPALVGITEDVIEKYAKNRDYSVIQPFVKATDSPVIYSVKRIEHMVFVKQCMTQQSDEMKAMRAFQFGVVAVENLRNDDGSKVNWSPAGRVGDVQYVTEEELARFSMAEIMEIGRVAFERSFLPKTTVGGYRLPRSSAELWANLQALSADASRTSPQTQASEKP